MVTTVLAPKWTPRGVVQRLRNVLRQPGDWLLGLRIGWFLWQLPPQMEQLALPVLLERLRTAPRPPAADAVGAVARIARLRQPWLNHPPLASRNTCYMRALTLYRFVDPRGRALRIHFGIEPGVDARDRLRGHAWITVNDEVFEPPDPLLAGRVREIYCHPSAD